MDSYLDEEPMSDIESIDSEEESESESDSSNNDIDEIEFNGLSDDDDEKSIKTQFSGVPYLTKFEMARVLGTRTQQIASGSKIFVERNEKESDFDIAMKELKSKKMPLIIRRYIGDAIIDLSVNSLKILNN